MAKKTGSNENKSHTGSFGHTLGDIPIGGGVFEGFGPRTGDSVWPTRVVSPHAATNHPKDFKKGK